MSGLLLVSYLALWALVVVMAVLLLLLYRHFGMMSLGTLEGVQRDGLSVGAAAPTIGGVTAAGTDASWNPKAGEPQLLMFVAPDCEPCGIVLPFVDRLSRSGAGIRVAAVTPGPQAEAARLEAKFRPSYPCLAEDGGGAFNRFRVRVTPFGFVISGDGRVLAKGLCSDQARLKSLLQAAGLREAANVVAATPEPVTLVTANGTGR